MMALYAEPCVFTAKVILASHRDGRPKRPLYTVDASTGTAFDVEWILSTAGRNVFTRWEFDEPMLVPGTEFTARFRCLDFERQDDAFPVGARFSIIAPRGFGQGEILSLRPLGKGAPLRWPSQAPSFLVLSPDRREIANWIPVFPPREDLPAWSRKMAVLLQNTLEDRRFLPWLLSMAEYELCEKAVSSYRLVHSDEETGNFADAIIS